MLAIAAILMTQLTSFYSVNNVGSDAHAAFGGSLGQAIVLYMMVINVALLPDWL